VVSFAAGEDLRTEISAKFRRAGIEAELAAAGMRMLRFWTDPGGDFGLTLAERSAVAAR
jgi:L-histidine Nalpha-methyltransferase